MISGSPTMLKERRPLSLALIVMVALAVHAPLLLVQLPAASHDASTHMFFGQQYARDWFNFYNPQWYGGMLTTGHAPLAHQLIALFSKIFGLSQGYMLLQLLAIVLLPVGVYRFAQIWVDERSAKFAALGSIFLGSLAMLVYNIGQLPVTLAAMLIINSVAFFYDWARRGNVLSLIGATVTAVAAASADPATGVAGLLLFGLPVLYAALTHRGRDNAGFGGALARSVIFAAVAFAGIALVLAPLSDIRASLGSPDSNANYFSDFGAGLTYWFIPFGALLLALPAIFWWGAGERRLRPLFLAFFIALLVGLGTATPLGTALLSRAPHLSFEQYTFWATLLCLPVVGLLASYLISRYDRRAVYTLAGLAVLTLAFATSRTFFERQQIAPFNERPVISFLKQEDKLNFRYLTLGFGRPVFSKIAINAPAPSLDGGVGLASQLPEVAPYDVPSLDNARASGANGMEALRAVLKHANHYGLRYIFVRDRFYEPLLAFAGWRVAEVYEGGNIKLWTKEDVGAIRPPLTTPLVPGWQRAVWGVVPIACAALAFILIIGVAARRRDDAVEPLPLPVTERDSVLRSA